ncbi:MAG: sigma 54-interacting transcriptional regulator [Planctomycetaceae bacterium]
MTTSRRLKRHLEAALAASSTPVFLLDARRRVTFFNTGCEALTGWNADEIVGRVCEYRTSAEPGDAASLTGSLCPPPEVFAGRTASVAAYIVAKNGASTSRRIGYFPLTNAAGAVEGVLGVVSPMEPASASQPELPARRLHAELASLRGSVRQRYGFRNFVARGGAMSRVLEQVRLARASAAGVLLFGPPGSGKEHVARTIHYASESAGRPFVPFDCGRLAPRELKNSLRRLLEEGHSESPAAIGAPGTIYFAEVDHVPRDLQEMLAGALGRESPSGSRSETVSGRMPAPRLMAGTARDPRTLLDEEILLPEFFYLVSALTIELPPLAERPDDLPLLGQHFLEARNRGTETQIGGIDEAVWRKFREYNWPGNLDELEHVVDEACDACLASGLTTLTVAELPFRFRTGLEAQASGPARTPRPLPLEPFLNEAERERIRLALEQAKHNKSQAADLLGISRTRLYRRMEALGIEDREG